MKWLLSLLNTLGLFRREPGWDKFADRLETQIEGIGRRLERCESRHDARDKADEVRDRELRDCHRMRAELETRIENVESKLPPTKKCPPKKRRR